MHRLVPLQALDMAERGLGRQSSTGAVLIVDVEGSTAVSGRLQPHGTEGAEAFAGILATLFRPMVARSVGAGGSVVDLPGDGILATFLGEPAQAVSAAAEAASGIMHDLSRVSTFDTPAGPADLTVRSAIGAGSVDWAVWTSDDGDAEQNAAYACLGSAVDEARLGESITPGGAISVGPTASASLPSRDLDLALVDGYHTIQPRHVDPPELVDLLPEPTLPTIRFTPQTLNEAEVRSEFRDVVAVFLELADSSTDPDRVTQALRSLARYRGYLSSLAGSADGIRLLAMWGAPTSHEHDIGYALRFVDELRSSRQSGVRAGVTRSTAFTGLIGGREREVYTAIGPGVNLASRMCDAANDGEIRVDDGIAALLSEPWGLEQLGAVEYRGLDRGVSTYSVTNVPPTVVADSTSEALIGRDDELDFLEDLVAPMWAGRSVGVIAVAGDPGIGKSRLIAALEDRLADRDPAPVWIHARADEISGQSLATLRDALSGYFGRPGDSSSGEALDAYLESLRGSTSKGGAELTRTRGTLGELMELPGDVERAAKLDPKTRFENVAIAVENLIESLEQTAPVIIAVSDGHWMDSGTAEIIERLVANLTTKRIAVILETRDPSRGIDHSHLLEVAPLDAPDLQTLAEGLLGYAPPQALVDELAERSGGNPFFAEQLIDFLRREDKVQDPTRAFDGLATDGEVPLDVRRVLVARLDGLSPDVRQTIQTGSVLGQDVDLEVLRRMLPSPETAEVLVRMAVGAGIWRHTDEGHVQFVSLLIRDAAYGMLLHSETRRLHGLAADAIEESHDVEPKDGDLAYHHDRAGNQDRAAEHYLAAGRSAARSHDNRQAHNHLERALELTPDSANPRRAAILRAIHDVLEIEGDRPAQERTIDAMSELAGDDPSARIEVALVRARYLSAVGLYTDAEEALAEMLPLATESGSAGERGNFSFLRAQLARYQGRIDEAVKHSEDARELFALEGDPPLLAKATDFAGGIAWERGDFETAVDLHRTAADLFTTAGMAVEESAALNNLGSAVFSTGDYARAREIHREGAELSREIGYRMGEGDHLDNMGGTAWAVGDLELALDYYTEALRIRQGMDDSWGIAISLGNLGATHRAQHDPGTALSLYRQALEIDERIGRRRGEAYDRHGIGLCHLDMGRYNLATESLREAARIREDLGETHLANESHVACAQAMLRSGDAAGAEELIESVLTTEGDAFFEGAVETTAARLRTIEVLESTRPELAGELRERTRQGVLERARLISDPGQRQSYLERVESHLRAVPDDSES